MTEVLFTDPACDQFRTLEPAVRQRIIAKLRTVREWPEHYLAPLKGMPYHRLRIGDYRVIVDWRKDRDELWVVAVGHRKMIYDRDY